MRHPMQMAISRLRKRYAWDSKITKYIETVTQDMTELQDTKQNKVLLR
jgi:hypothetical protein